MIDHTDIAAAKPVVKAERNLALEVRSIAATEIVIQDQASYEAAGKILVEIAARKKKVAAFFAEPKEKAHEAHKSICKKEKEMLAPLEDVERKVKRLMGEYFSAEQARIQAEKERQRIEAEKLMELAVESEEQGETELAHEAVVAAAVEAVKVTYMPKAQGTSTKMVWKFRVIDLDKVPDYLIIKTVDENMLKGMMKGFGEKPSKDIPGIEFYREPQMSVRVR